MPITIISVEHKQKLAEFENQTVRADNTMPSPIRSSQHLTLQSPDRLKECHEEALHFFEIIFGCRFETHKNETARRKPRAAKSVSPIRKWKNEGHDKHLRSVTEYCRQKPRAVKFASPVRKWQRGTNDKRLQSTKEWCRLNGRMNYSRCVARAAVLPCPCACLDCSLLSCGRAGPGGSLLHSHPEAI